MASAPPGPHSLGTGEQRALREEGTLFPVEGDSGRAAGRADVHLFTEVQGASHTEPSARLTPDFTRYGFSGRCCAFPFLQRLWLSPGPASSAYLPGSPGGSRGRTGQDVVGCGPGQPGPRGVLLLQLFLACHGCWWVRNRARGRVLTEVTVFSSILFLGCSCALLTAHPDTGPWEAHWLAVELVFCPLTLPG